ncbi:adenine nucleotide alpha hydrolases-like protein [Suillus weaverae]|nr:adenine nucleotide alpha hydrolases-like protein [Suillus weaverae]
MTFECQSTLYFKGSITVVNDSVEIKIEILPTVLILDFSSQYSHIITRRSYAVYIKASRSQIQAQRFAHLSLYSVYDDDAPHVDPGIYTLRCPYPCISVNTNSRGIQEICWNRKGQVAKCDHREYGLAEVQISRFSESGNSVDALFEGLGDQMQVGLDITRRSTPPDFHVIRRTSTAPYAAIAHNSNSFYGIQLHPEVTHFPQGRQLIGRFVLNICQCGPNWTMEEFIGKEIVCVRAICGLKGRVIAAVSRGVDSTAAAKLMHEAIGDRFHAIMVDNGVLRLNEPQQVNDMLNKDLGVNLTVVDASELFISRLDGIEDPEQKRKIIGNTFINVFETELAKIEEAAEKEESGANAKGKIEWLLQGTLYPDVIKGISFKGPSATIKTHHNLIKLLRELFKGLLNGILYLR